MTTAFLDITSKILYADRQETWGKVKVGSTKIFQAQWKNASNGFFAVSGNTVESIKLLNHFRSKESILDLYKNDDKKLKIKDIEFLYVNNKNEAWTIGKEQIPIPIENRFTVIGAGWEMGLALLQSGIPPNEVFKTIANNTTHTSRDYNFIHYLEKNAKLQYNENKE